MNAYYIAIKSQDVYSRSATTLHFSFISKIVFQLQVIAAPQKQLC